MEKIEIEFIPIGENEEYDIDLVEQSNPFIRVSWEWIGEDWKITTLTNITLNKSKDEVYHFNNVKVICTTYGEQCVWNQHYDSEEGWSFDYYLSKVSNEDLKDWRKVDDIIFESKEDDDTCRDILKEMGLDWSDVSKEIVKKFPKFELSEGEIPPSKYRDEAYGPDFEIGRPDDV